MGLNIIGYGQKTLANPSTAVTLAGGQFQLLPSGQYIILPGKYTFLQWYDPVSQTWKTFSGPLQQGAQVIISDGYNYRLFNPTGSIVGGVVTNGGTANTALNGIYAAGSTVVSATTTIGTQASTPVAKALFNVIVGGVVNTTVTVTSGGANYSLPPIVTFSAPPAGGLQATGYALLTAGVVSSVVVTNQGAGYTSAPTITVTSVAGDAGTGAVLTATLDTVTNNGKITAVTMANNGAGYVSNPTVTISGLAGSPAITPIVCYAITTAPTVSSGTNLGNGHQLVYVAQTSAASPTTTNPLYTQGVFTVRNGLGAYNTSATGGSQVILDGGLSQVDVSNLPVITLSPNGTTPGAATYASGASGAVFDTSYVLPV